MEPVTTTRTIPSSSSIDIISNERIKYNTAILIHSK